MASPSRRTARRRPLRAIAHVDLDCFYVQVERRDYRPHLTLAYLKPDADPDRIGAWIADHNLLRSPPIRIDRFGLWSSVLTEDGSRYDLEREYRL